jgi:hypothetical protein
VPKDTLVLSTYRCPDVVNDHEPEVKVTVKEAHTNNVIVDQNIHKEGKFVFTSHVGGEHQICFSTVSKSFFGGSGKRHVRLNSFFLPSAHQHSDCIWNCVQRVHLRIDMGEAAVDYDAVAKTEHLSAIEIEVRKLIDKLSQIRQETVYQREREEEFRNTSESTNARIAWFSLGETLLLVFSGLYQVFHLKTFFKGKKLV